VLSVLDDYITAGHHPSPKIRVQTLNTALKLVDFHQSFYVVKAL
jgi:hypothetical protein